MYKTCAHVQNVTKYTLCYVYVTFITISCPIFYWSGALKFYIDNYTNVQVRSAPKITPILWYYNLNADHMELKWYNMVLQI